MSTIEERITETPNISSLENLSKFAKSWSPDINLFMQKASLSIKSLTEDILEDIGLFNLSEEEDWKLKAFSYFKLGGEKTIKQFAYALNKTNNYEDFHKVLSYIWFPFDIDTIMYQGKVLEEIFLKQKWLEMKFKSELKEIFLGKFNSNEGNELNLEKNIDDILVNGLLALKNKDNIFPEDFNYLFKELLYKYIKDFIQIK